MSWSICDPELETLCMVCGGEADFTCDCQECPGCGVTGDPDCHRVHGLPYAHDSVRSLCDHIGIYPIWSALRAVDRHNVESICLILEGGEILGVDDREKVERLPDYTRISKVRVSGIAWDGSCWEWGEDVPAGNGWSAMDDAREAFLDALSEHRAQTHGCEHCHPDGTCDEWGNEFAPGELGVPINPNCVSCEGAGACL